METLTLEQLQIGDVARNLYGPGLSKEEGAFMDLTVVGISEENVKFIRPYVHLANFTFSGTVIHYLGTEEVTVPKGWGSEYQLMGNIYHGR